MYQYCFINWTYYVYMYELLNVGDNGCGVCKHSILLQPFYKSRTLLNFRKVYFKTVNKN